ncbi:polycomb group RING finger protein 1 isoform X2 [Lingula anatina]|nr:polycomb group RING finger protein 1 isoform X2 [Lingula anatina]|eukprot:XP_013406835.1 polycomb group RING finger protein 1 isoform X2 [Lingula anatina]
MDATTIRECLHTFCKSCIVKYLQSSKNCPQCGIKIHETQPLSGLKADNVMQDIVYKLVTNLFENEEKRKEEFCKSRGINVAKELNEADQNVPLTSVYDSPTGHHYSNDELVSLCLERDSLLLPLQNINGQPVHIPPLDRKFIRCSTRTRIAHVKKLLRKKLVLSQSLKLTISCSEASGLDDNWNLKQIWLQHWLDKDPPLILYYAISSS